VAHQKLARVFRQPDRTQMKIKRRTSQATVPSMAMGDIAFNLLIFFVILARAQDDSHLEWNPADAANIQSTGPAKVSVLVDTENNLYLNGQQVGIASLASQIQEQLGDLPAGERIVLLKVHKETLAQRFEPIIEAISEAGGDLVHVVEESKP
jgi:biopolymer transport protein ExbD